MPPGFFRSFAGRRRVPSALVVWAALAVACSSGDGNGDDGPTGPSGSSKRLTITVDGRLERGMVVNLSATLEGAPVSAGVSWSASPAGAVEFLSPGTARLKSAGAVQIRAESTGAAGQLSIQVATPPTIVFDMRRNGNRDIYRVALDGQDLTRLTTHELEDLSPTAVGGTVVYTGYRKFQIDDRTVVIADLYSVPLTGGSETRRTSTVDAELAPALSRNGQRLAYLRTGGSPVEKVWVSDASGSNATRATSATNAPWAIESSPSWAPDNNRLVYMSTHAGGAGLFILDASTGAIEPLLVDPMHAYVEPAWSPDGQWIAFASNRDGSGDIYRIHVSTKQLQRLTTSPEAAGQPAWLPDGRIVFTSWSGYQSRLRWLDPADPQRVFDIPVDGDSPQNPVGVF